MCEAKNGISPGLSKVIELKINGKSIIIIVINQLDFLFISCISIFF